MKTKVFLFLFPFSLLLATSCGKDYPNVGGQEAFSYAGSFYSTLQDAVNAVFASSPDEIATITLNKNITDSGVIIPEGDIPGIVLELGNNILSLLPGKQIDVQDGFLEISGSNGILSSYGDTFAIEVGEDAFLRLSGNCKLQADKLLETSAPVSLSEGFSGSIDGDIFLKNTSFTIYPSKCSVEIPVLSVIGKEALFEVDVEDVDDKPVIHIGKVVSDNSYPVSALKAGAVSVSDGQVHVHDLSSGVIHGTCVEQDTYVLECKDCGYQIPDKSFHEPTFGKCDINALIRHERVEPGPCQFGNISYYECPECGRVFSDAQASNEINDAVTILPTNIDEMLSIFAGTDINLITSEPYGPNALTPAAVEKIYDLIIGLITTIPGVITTEYQTWTTPVKAFRDFSKRLSDFSGRLSQIENQITQISAAVNNVPYVIKVRNRINQLNDINDLNLKTNAALSLVFNDNTKTQAQMDSLKALNIQQWSGIYEGSTATLHPHELILGLMRDFSTVAVGPNMPQMYGEVVSSYFIWDHLGYTTRALTLLYDAIVVSTAYYFAQNYARVNKPYSSDVVREKYRQTLEASYKDYANAVQAEFQRMMNNGKKYRRFMPTNTTFERQVYTTFNFYDFFMTDKPLYLPRHDARVSIDNCNEMMEYNGTRRLVGSSFMDASVASQTYQYYKSMQSQGKLPEGFPKDLNVFQLLDSLGFDGISKISNLKLLMNSAQAFSQKGGDIEFPMYWNVRWRSYRGSIGYDWISAGPVLDNNANTYDDRLISRCNISTDNGFVSGISVQSLKDDLKKKTFAAIIVSKQDQLPKTDK